MSDYSETDYSDAELLRQKNIAERNAMLAALLDDPELKEAIESIRSAGSKKNVKIKREAKKDSAFKFSGTIPSESRKSSRLQHKQPDFRYEDLPDEKGISIAHRRRTISSYEDLESVVLSTKSTKRITRIIPNEIIPVSEVTQSMLDSVQLQGVKKLDETRGTSCHQCRQKSVDTKTICRSGFCYGVRGQFCGICVVNRYGEDPLKALLDPNWSCYVCRGVCNCSFCRIKAGKRPTGVLTPTAQKNGFKSVHDFLVHLTNGKSSENFADDPEALLGFDGSVVVLKGHKRVPLSVGAEKIDPDLIDDDENDLLLGFEGNVAVLKNRRIPLRPPK